MLHITFRVAYHILYSVFVLYSVLHILCCILYSVLHVIAYSVLHIIILCCIVYSVLHIAKGLYTPSEKRACNSHSDCTNDEIFQRY